MNQNGKDSYDSKLWKRTLAIMLVISMVAMVASPIFAAGEEAKDPPQDRWDMNEGTGGSSPEAESAHIPMSQDKNMESIPLEPPSPRPWAVLTYYTDRPTFDTDAPGLPVEDFEASNVPPGGITADDGPFNSATNNLCYSTGALIDGFSIDCIPIALPPNLMVVLATGALGIPSTVVGPNMFLDDTDITFPGLDVNTVGMDLLTPMVGPVTVNIDIYGIGGVLLDSTTAITGTLIGEFWGVKCNEVITQIIITEPGGEGELLDNLAFGMVAGGLENVLIYADDFFHAAPNTYVDQALNALGLTYTAHYDGDHAGFEADLTGGGPWDLVIYSGENYNPPDSAFDAMNTYVSGGGNLICCEWDIADRPAHPLWNTMGFTYQGDYGPPLPVYWWEPGHQVFNTPESVPEFTSVADPGYGTNGHRVEPLGGFDPLAGHTTPGPDPNEATLIYGNGGRTIYKSWLDGGNDANLDGDGLLDGVELWIDMISNFGESTLPTNVAIFQTTDPWGFDSIQQIYDSHTIPYVIYGTADIGVVDLSPYDKIILVYGDGQDQIFFDTIAANTAWFEGYTDAGACLNIHLAPYFALNVPGLPFGLDAFHPYEGEIVDIAIPGHALLTTPNIITDPELDNWNYAYHDYFTTWPPGADVVLTEGDTGSNWPVCLDFPWGDGRVIATGQTVEWAWGHGYSTFLENLLLAGSGGAPAPPPPDYGFELTPDTQTRFGWIGDWVDHTITIQNTGTMRDVYLPMFHNNNWWTKFHNIDIDIVTGERTKGEQTWWVGPVWPGGSIDFIASVFMPRVVIGDFDRADITITSHGDGSVANTVEIFTRTSLGTPYYNDFESGVFGQGVTPDLDWTTDNTDRAGVNDMTACPPSTFSMYTRWGPVAITSCMMHMDDIPIGIVSCWIQRGDPGFSEKPDGGEDLVIEYQREGVDQWMQLDSFPGDGEPGEIFWPLYVLPDNALHPRFQLRFRQLDGDGSDEDYWHIDNVYIGPPTPNFDLTPDTTPTFDGVAGEIFQYDMQITNNALHPDIYDLSVMGATAPAGTYVLDFEDDFDDGNYNGWTIVDEGTTSAPSNWFVDGSGYLRQNTNIHIPYGSCGQDFPGTYVWNGDTTWTDYIYKSRFQSTDNDIMGVMARYQDQDNYYRFHWTRQGWDQDRTTPGMQYWVLDKKVNGAWSVITSDTGSAYTASQWYDIEMKLIGDRILVYVDGALVFDVTDDSLDSGAVALYCWGNTGSYYDDVEVWGSSNTLGPIPPGETGDFIAVIETPAVFQVGDVYNPNIVVRSALDPWAGTDITPVNILGPTVYNVDLNTWHVSIQDGIDMANPGDTLMAYPKIYNENVVVDRPLTITGVDRATTIIDGGGATVVTIDSEDNVNVNDFTIQNGGVGPGDWGIYINDAQNCNIENNRITSYNGINMEYSGGNNILNNILGRGTGNLVDEDFEGAFPPPGWQEVVYGGDGHWETRTTDGSWRDPSGASGTYAIADSDANAAWIYDVGLRTPMMNLNGYSTGDVTLDCGLCYENYAGLCDAYVRVWSDAGLEEVLGHWDSDQGPFPFNAILDLDSYVSLTDVQVEFYYTSNGNTWLWFYSVDNVLIQAPILSGTGIRVLGSGYDNHFQDDFSTDTGRWTYYGSASRTGDYLELTPSTGGIGQIWFDQPITSGMTVDFDYWIGDLGGGGADGMAFMFYHDTAYVPGGGGTLGFGNPVPGYGIEFDHWDNGGNDPSNEHIALIQDSPYNPHLTFSDENIDDGAWHHARVMVGSSKVYVYNDDMNTPIFTWSAVLDTTFSGFGFTAATGGSTASHRIDNVDISWGTLENTIEGNTIQNFNTGVSLEFANGNNVYHNNFIDNTVQAFDDWINTWDNGYPSGGNYWSNYVGADVFSGPLQNIPGSDGLGDTPHAIGCTQDKYPFMSQITASGSLPTVIVIYEDPSETETEEAEGPIIDAGGTGHQASAETQPEPANDVEDEPATEEITEVQETVESVPEPVTSDVIDEDVTTQPVDNTEEEATKNKGIWMWTLLPVFLFITLVPSTHHYRKKKR